MTSQQCSLLRRTITSQLSDDEHALFLEACHRSGLDPFARQIYFLRERGKLVIQATIDGLRISAERSGHYGGQLGPEWCGPDGAWKDIWTQEEPPAAARVGIRRADFADPVWGKALYSEFVQETEFWRGMPTLMLAKVAEALAFRKAFPAEFSGLYTPEEKEGVKAATPSNGVRNWVTPISQVAADPPEFSGRLAGFSSDSPALRDSRIPVDNPERGDGVSFPAVPAPLQPFFEAGLTNRVNLQAAYGFIQKELEHELGASGLPAFRRIYAGHFGHGLFTSREKCAAANRACMLELWHAVEGRRAA